MQPLGSSCRHRNSRAVGSDLHNRERSRQSNCSRSILDVQLAIHCGVLEEADRLCAGDSLSTSAGREFDEDALGVRLHRLWGDAQ